jgi:hypothetical protein
MSAHAKSDRKPTLFPLAVAGIFTAALADAQTVAPPADGAGGASGLLVFLGVMAALFIVVAVVVKTMDRRRKRDEEAVQLQARIADAMLLDPTLGKLAITASVMAPFSRASSLAIEVHGEAPTTALRDEALSLVIREATASGVPFHIEDRITVGGRAHRAA